MTEEQIERAEKLYEEITRKIGHALLEAAGEDDEVKEYIETRLSEQYRFEL